MRMRLGRLAILLLLIARPLTAANPVRASSPPACDHEWGPSGLEIRFRKLDPAVLAGMVERKTTREQWSSRCAVRAYFGIGEIPRDLPPLLGSYTVSGDVLAFRPR